MTTLYPSSGRLVSGDAVALLTRQQSTIMEAVVRAKHIGVTNGSMIERMYPDPDREPEWPDNVLKVQLCKLRRKLRDAAIPVSIGSVHGRGLVCLDDVGIVE